MKSWISIPLFSLLSVLQITDGCPDGWTEYGLRCYRIELRDWVGHKEASTACTRRGATLAGLSDPPTTQFITELLNTSWSTSNQCRLQRRDCLTAIRDTIRYCSQQPCLNLWVGLTRGTPCGSACQPGNPALRTGWSWRDGTPYGTSDTAWGTGQPVNDSEAVRFGINDGSMVMTLASYDEYWRFGYICSRLKSSTAYAGPEYPEEGLGGGVGGAEPSNYSNLKVGLAVGLSVGGAFLIAIVITIIVVVKNCLSKKKTETAQIANPYPEKTKIYYAKQRETIYFSSEDPYGIVSAAEPRNIKPLEDDTIYKPQSEV